MKKKRIIAILVGIAMIVVGMGPLARAQSSSGTGRTYTTDADFEEGVLVGVEAVEGRLQLAEKATTLPFIWVPNNEGTVSKVDTETGDELGRYTIAPPDLPEGGSPSRTTVDLEGNVWVGNRTAGTVVKIGLLEGGQCVDRDADGTIQTSRDLDGYGNITGEELLPWGEDECVLFEVVLVPEHEGTYVPGTYEGPYDTDYWGTAPRSLAVDAENNLWVGTGSPQKFYYIDGTTGEILKEIDVSPWHHNAYGATIDRNGVIWSLRSLLRIDPSALDDDVVEDSNLEGHSLNMVGETSDASDIGLLDASSDVSVHAGCNTYYNHHTFADSVDNTETELHVGVGTHLYNIDEGTDQAVQDPILDLSSEYTFEDVYSSGDLVEPPEGIDYRWGFDDIPAGHMEHAEGWLDSVMSKTGFVVSRQVDQSEFTEPDTQTLTLQVTPKETMENLWIHLRPDVDGLDAAVTSATGPDHEISEGNFGAEVEDPETDHPYEWEITIEIRSFPEGFEALEYMPDIWTRNVVDAADGSSSSSNLSMDALDLDDGILATWDWQAEGEYLWHWRREVNKQVHLGGYTKDPHAPIRSVHLPHQQYALAPDYLGHLFITGWEDDKLSKIDIETDEIIFTKDTPEGCARGVAVTADNNAWVADTCRDSVLRYDNDGEWLDEITGVVAPSGVSVDAAGKVWVTDMGSEDIHRIDPSTNEIDLSKEIIGSGGHYSYSDMTGMVARTITTKIGTWTVVHDSGAEDTPWGLIYWTSDEPEGTSIAVKARSSNDGSSWSSWEAVQDEEPLTDTPDGRYIQVETTLQTAVGEESPILYDLTVKPAEIEVPTDIRPQSCPNPLNVNAEGVLPAAILGTEDLDVTQIDPDTVQLAGVSPLEWALEDVATPYTDEFSDPPARDDCTTEGADGYLDLTLKFDNQEVVAALGEVEDGDVLFLELSGQLTDGTPIVGEDIVWIIKK